MLESIIMTSILGLVVQLEPIRDNVTCIEVNHHCRCDGKELIHQAIFWELRNGVWMVRDWRLLKRPEQYPRKDPRTGLYYMRWFDRDDYREVRTRTFVETWSEFDPEMQARAVMPQKLRRKLSSPTTAYPPALPPRTQLGDHRRRNPWQSLDAPPFVGRE